LISAIVSARIRSRRDGPPAVFEVTALLRLQLG
jgi:hypothetical protein